MVSCFFGRSAYFRENVETRNHGKRGWHTSRALYVGSEFKYKLFSVVREERSIRIIYLCLLSGKLFPQNILCWLVIYAYFSSVAKEVYGV
jgi:hypothetical protein